MPVTISQRFGPNAVADRGIAPVTDAGIAAVGSNRLYFFLGNLVFVLILVGYPFSAALSQFLGMVSSDINVTFRIIHAILSLLLLGWTVARRSFSFDWLLGLFFMIYMVRLWSDLTYSFLPDIARDFQFFLATVFIPTIAMSGGRTWFNERICLLLTAVIGFLAAVMIAYNLTLGPVVAFEPDPNQRASLEFLNPISIGYHGLFVASAALILLVRYRTPLTILFVVPGVLLGGYLLIISGSRGPFVALALALAITGFANKRANAIYVLGGIIAAGFLAYFGTPELLLNRFLETGQDASSLERVYTLELAVDQATQNPIFGYAYIEPITNRYPHNLIVEAALAMGLGGAAMMAWMQISLLWNAWTTARASEWLLPLLAGMVLANAWLSGSLWGSGLFFAVLWLLRDSRTRRRTSLNNAKHIQSLKQNK